MGKINICLELFSDTNDMIDASLFETSYQTVFKNLLSFLYSHPKFLFTFAYTGPQLAYMAEEHPEAIELLRELTTRRQVELLGGGYYAPIFPLLFPVDRSGQIEKMTGTLRTTIGKRPRGMTLFGSIWDPSLIPALKKCDMEYVHVDNELVPPTTYGYRPLIVTEQHKSIKVLPLYSALRPQKEESCRRWLGRIRQLVQKDAKRSDASDSNPVVTIVLEPRHVTELAASHFFDSVLECLAQEDCADMCLALPQQYLKTARNFVPAYIPAGMDARIGRWVKDAQGRTEHADTFPCAIQDFLNAFPPVHRLYDRMMDISERLLQHGGDKMRKQAAREKLWEAQAGIHYISLPDGHSAAMRRQQEAYRALNEAERLIRDGLGFEEALYAFDYNGDGTNEYVCRIQSFHALIDWKGGQLRELNMLGNNGGNYAAAGSGIFVEQLLDEKELQRYLHGTPTEGRGFLDGLFTEKKCDARRKEVQLEGHGSFASPRQPVTVQKNYQVSSNGFVVQYIVKNESDAPMKAYFVVESHFTQTRFAENEKPQYAVEMIHNGDKKAISIGDACQIKKGVSLLQIKDDDSKMTFSFEPNEEAGLYCAFLSSHEHTHSLRSCFYWQVDVAAHRAMEKTINLSIFPIKPRKLR